MRFPNSQSKVRLSEFVGCKYEDAESHYIKIKPEIDKFIKDFQKAFSSNVLAHRNWLVNIYRFLASKQYKGNYFSVIFSYAFLKSALVDVIN